LYGAARFAPAGTPIWRGIVEKEEFMQRALAVVVLIAAAFAAASSVAQAGVRKVQVSICAGSDCRTTGSQHNFTQPGWVRVPTGLPSAFVVKSLTHACAAFCNNAVYWPKIELAEGRDGTCFLLNAHHNGSLDSSSIARRNVYTMDIWVHY
jgi:hypothetical protein